MRSPACNQADVVVHDALVDPRVLALAGPQARLEFAGKRGGKPSATQGDITRRLIELARAGQRVLRLKGGDPFVFGRGGEEAKALAAAGVPFRVIPGVTAGLAALAAASIPATLRGVNRAVIFAAGHGADEDFDWAPLARAGQPIVLYMVMHNLEQIAAALLAAGLPAADARRHHRFGGYAETAGSGLDAGKAFRRCARAEIRTAGDRSDRRDREFSRAAGRRGGIGREQRKGARVTARGLIIAAPHSGAGKTTVALALMAALRRRGLVVRAAKAGPDYIDPAFHAAVTGSASVNLDSWAMSRELLDALAAQAADGADIVVIEGVMGLFDGAAAAAGQRGATADLAAHFGLPVLLVLDVARQAQSAAALVRGFAAHDPAVNGRGRDPQPRRQRTAPRARRRRYRRARYSGPRRAAARDGAGAAGASPRPRPGSRAHRTRRADRPSRRRGRALSRSRRHCCGRGAVQTAGTMSRPSHAPALPPPGQRIALASDRAFSFVYPHLIEAWRHAGAEIFAFSPLADEPPPEQRR